MRRTSLIPSVLVIGFLAYVPALAESPKFDTPAAVIAAAETAYGNRDYATFADCFDAAGQKVMDAEAIQMIGVYATLTASTDHGKACKAFLEKHGLTDLTAHAGETDDQLYARLAGQLKDPHAFLAEATPVAYPNTDNVKPRPGKLTNLKIDGAKATASYDVQAGSAKPYTMSQAMTFTQSAGAWRISTTMDFAPTGGLTRRVNGEAATPRGGPASADGPTPLRVWLAK